MNIRNLIWLSAIALFISQNAHAGMRCENGKLASRNDKATEVLVKCGWPHGRRSFGTVTVGDNKVNVERWMYVPEPGKFVKYLEFHNGVLKSISNGNRVK